MTTAYVTHEDYVLHDLHGHPEHAGRIRRIWQVFEQHSMSDKLMTIEPTSAPREALERVHHAQHIDLIERMATNGIPNIDSDTYLTPYSNHCGLLSAGGCLVAVDAILEGKAQNAMAITRPPGHHATPSRAMGFCLFNNAAIAARHAQATNKAIKRVMIVDYDVHHGNGTQDATYDDPSILYVSTHQYPFYPGTGAMTDIGEADGRGFTLNMPLDAGVGNAGLGLLYEKVLWPKARLFRPDLIILSAGFDAHDADPLAMLQLDLYGYAAITRTLVDMAEHLCGGRLLFVLEGGYNLDALSHGVLNAAYALLGEDQFIDPLGNMDDPGTDVSPLVDDLVALHNL